MATAQETIGVAATIRNEVNGKVASRTFQINAGENVFRQEVVATGRDSSAKLVFKDSTNLAVGPETSVTLDRFVYAGTSDYKKVTLQLLKGAFRFITGSSDKRAYEIRTDVARIGVRGTIGDLLVEAGRTIAVVQQGVLIACSINNQCTELSRPGEAAVVTATSVTNEGVGGAGGWSFASLCAGDLCEATRFASLQPPPGGTRVTSFEVGAAPRSTPSGRTAVSTPSEQPVIASNEGAGSEAGFAATAVLASGALAATIAQAAGEKTTLPNPVAENVRQPYPPPNVVGDGNFTLASPAAAAASPASIAAALSPSIASQTGIAAAQSAFVSTNSFLRLIFDFTGAGGGQRTATAIGYASERQLPPEVARAYAAVTPKDRVYAKAPAALGWTEPSWAFWGAAFGANARLEGDVLVGSHDVTSRIFGGAAGAEYLMSPNSKIGLAFAGGTTDYSLANNFGSGRSDFVQGSLYSKTYFGPAYLTAALAAGAQWVKSNRTVVAGPALDALVASFTMPTLASRLEAGYRFGAPYAGFTPYGAVQTQTAYLPAYVETATFGAGATANAVAPHDATSIRSELGAWADTWIGTSILLRARAAWIHEFTRDTIVSAQFAVLPGTTFAVSGAQRPVDAALVSGVIEVPLTSYLTLSGKFDGEFGRGATALAGAGQLRWSW